MNDRLIIFDTTLRDGEQSPGASMNLAEKLQVAHALKDLGVDVIEAGFPIASPGDFEAVQRIAREVRGATICGLARAVPIDVDRAAEAVKDAEDPRIHVFISSSDIHLAHQIRKNRSEVLEITDAMVRRAKSYVSNVEFSPMDATRSEPEYLLEILAVAAGATTLNIPDTVGFAVPEEFGNLIAYLIEHVPGADKVIFSTHCHDDLGMAVANSLTGVKRGARQIECTINGIGERAGNCSLEEVVMALRTRQDYYGVDTRIDTTQLYKTSRMVSNYTGILVQPNKAVVGANAFAHESGIHQDGVLKERTTYEIINPSDVGIHESKIILTARSGLHALPHRLRELGYECNEEQIGRIYARFLELADRKKQVYDEDLEILVANETSMLHRTYELLHVQVSCGDKLIPTATVSIRNEAGDVFTDSCHGTGPVDAVYRAINRIVNEPNELIEFSVQAVTQGIDALADVTIRIRRDNDIYTGRGADSDIVVASAKAYMHALNKLVDRASHASRKEGVLQHP